MNCPKCLASLDNVQFFSLQFQRCSGCKGVWCNENVLHVLELTLGAEMLDIGTPAIGHAFNEATVGDCPNCKEPNLIAKPVEGHEYLTAEHCQSCRYWFLDAGELAQCGKHGVVSQARSWIHRWVTS